MFPKTATSKWQGQGADRLRALAARIRSGNRSFGPRNPTRRRSSVSRRSQREGRACLPFLQHPISDFFKGWILLDERPALTGSQPSVIVRQGRQTTAFSRSGRRRAIPCSRQERFKARVAVERFQVRVCHNVFWCLV